MVMTSEEMKKAFYENEGLSFFGKIKCSITSPTTLFNSVKGENGIKNAFIFYAIVSLIPYLLLSLIFILLAGILSMIPGFELFGLLGGFSILIMLGSWFISLFINFVSAGLMHLFVRLLGGRNGYSNTYKAACYCIAPMMLLFWIPLLNIAIAIYTIYLFAKGISIMQDMSIGRALAAIFIPIIITLMAVIFIIAGFMLVGVMDPTAFTQKGCKGFQYFTYEFNSATSDQFSLALTNGASNITIKSLKINNVEVTDLVVVPPNPDTFASFVIKGGIQSESNLQTYPIEIAYETNGISNVDSAICLNYPLTRY